MIQAQPVIDLETAKSQARNTYRETLECLKNHCLAQNETQFYDRVIKVLNRTPIYWEKIGLLDGGQTHRRRNDNGQFSYEIVMNIKFLYSEDAASFIKYTLIHELAHVIADVYDGSFCHNETFQRFDRLFGGTGKESLTCKKPILKIHIDTSMRVICAPRRS